MADDDTEEAGRRSNQGEAGTAVGPLYVLWENSLEKLKILNYENEYCGERGRKPFSRVHFIFPGKNMSNQFDEFMDICGWLCTVCSGDPETFKRDPYDDPNTVANKLMLALRQLDCRLSFPSQKLKAAHGEAVCSVLDFLTDKALSVKNFRWAQPVYTDADIVEMAEDDVAASLDDIEDEVDGGVEEDDLYQEDARLEMSEVSLDSSARQIHTSEVDPIHWKTELERVGPKLRAKQQLSTNEWRAHVDMTVASKSHIEKVLGETEGDLQALNREISDELNKIRSKERYTNNQFAALSHEFKEVKLKLEELEAKSGRTNESVIKLTNDLAEVSERLEELKESFESRDSGMNDTSPLVRMKSALQQIKAEIHEFDLRIGVVAHSVLMARVGSTNRRRKGAQQNARRRRHKNKKGQSDNYVDGGEIDEL
mmetsp:Transcript_21622/g.31468  ORF Transcript_21622/g.31468 Transcript_21622/m.31468 type:complete len:426 (-) Transcript_21622:119-1396(-)|eukprot:CAMPEP_0185026814 /NCGR_PEP_ID=MMETSP1103-20130426/11297_1 /TAXON_ID=36769 /ORGANISM="Paraphysomonas bandaiensis, Strain Caron Lab Isolate" /LENGTH=425 /DNA_ID=CAMNT_0027560521 /DNA_START=31 /DNA_END=1308 /DNA_ORIENTATION=-